LPLWSPQEELGSLLNPATCVLDIGAGVNKPLKQSIRLSTQRYFSLDTDPAGQFDFHSFEDIPTHVEFDLMVANQVLEHLTVADVLATLRAAHGHLASDGHFLATVPNPAHPVRQWGDATHMTAWPMYDLYGVFRAAGFYVRALTRYNKHPLPRNPIKRIIVNVVCEVFRVDWCDSLMIVGQEVGKNAETSEGN